MINFLLRNISKVLNLDSRLNILSKEDEKILNIFRNLKKPVVKKSLKKKNILVINGSFYDRYNFCFIHLLLNSKQNIENQIFYAPTILLNLSYHKNFIYFILKFFLREISIFFEKKKIILIYKTLKQGNFFFINNSKKFFHIGLMIKSIFIFRKIKTKVDLENFKYKGVKIGDLIYDTYIRYKKECTVDLKSKFLFFLIFTSVYNFRKYELFLKKNNIKSVFSVDNAYIHNGLIQRIALFNNINYYVFSRTLPINQHIKKNSHQDFSNHPSYKENSKIFHKLKNKKTKILEAENLLKKKFKGEILFQESYMLKSAFSSKVKKLKRYEAIIFLHDFMDTAHGLGNNIFSDYYEWFINTLDFISKNKLKKKVAIKPHPNSIWISKNVEKKLKKEYYDFNWIDSKISNKVIFKKISKFGITVHGTIIGELAYHGIPTVSCGDNQAMSFKFNFNAKSKTEYYKMLYKGFNNQLKLHKNTYKDVCKMAYMQYLYEKPGIDLLIKPAEFNNLGLERNDGALIKYSRLFNKKVKQNNDYF